MNENSDRQNKIQYSTTDTPKQNYQKMLLSESSKNTTFPFNNTVIVTKKSDRAN